MRLIDADALRERYKFCIKVLPDDAKTAKRQIGLCIKMLRTAPTVCCEECTHSTGPNECCQYMWFYGDDEGSHDIDACSLFERRQG